MDHQAAESLFQENIAPDSVRTQSLKLAVIKKTFEVTQVNLVNAIGVNDGDFVNLTSIS